MPSDLAIDLMAGLMSATVAYSMCYVIATVFLPHAPCVAFATDAIFGLFYYPLIVYLAACATFRLSDNVESRWQSTSSYSHLLGLGLVSRMIVHVPFLLKKRRSGDKKMRPIYLLHHAVVIIVYLTGLILRRAHFWGAMNALCETTNVFLTIIELLTSCHEDTRSQWSTLHLLSSLGFGISYFLFRLVLFPVLIIWFSADIIRFPDDTWLRMSTFELLAYPMATLIIFGLSIKWSVPVARGTLQSLHRLVQQEVKSA